MAKKPHRARRQVTDTLTEVTVGAIEGKEQRQAALRPLSTGEVAQIYQVEVSGQVGAEIVTVDFNVNFVDPFLMRVGASQTDMLYDQPQYCTGVQMQSERPIILDAQILGYGSDDSDFIVGARCRLFAWSPEARKKFKFNALIHMTFIGYSGPSEDETDG